MRGFVVGGWLVVVTGRAIWDGEKCFCKEGGGWKVEGIGNEGRGEGMRGDRRW